MYDRNTMSLWSQVLGKAVAGPLEGTKLEQLPSEVTTWAAWKERHPNTLVLVKPAGLASVYADYHRDPEKVGIVGSMSRDLRLPGKALVFGLTSSGQFAAVPFSVLEKNRVLNTEAFGTAITVFSPPGETAVMAFERTVDGQVLTFEQLPGQGRLGVRDAESGSTWSWERGECLQGPFQGKRLKRIAGLPVYWAIWVRFHPGTAVIGAGKREVTK
jgi:hypothetical protein